MFRINRTLTSLLVGSIAAVVISVMACGTNNSEQDSGSEDDDDIEEELLTPGHSHYAPSIASHDGICIFFIFFRRVF